MNKKITQKIRDNLGASLSEMLACVVIVSLVSILACTGILTAYRKTHDMERAVYRQELGTMLMDRIVEELSEAMDETMCITTNSVPIEGTPESSHMKPGTQQIAFSDSTGIKTRIYINNENLLEIWYLENHDSSKKVPDSYWTFSRESYHGYEIKNLGFQYKKGSDDKVYITTTLELKSENSDEEIDPITRTACCSMVSPVRVKQ